MTKKAAKSFMLASALFGFGSQVEAHTFGAEGAGWWNGVVHPLIGPDHLLAMVAVGIWAVQLGGTAIWRLPLAFVGMMSLAAVAAAYGPVLPFLETGIALSVLILGGLVLYAARLPVGLDLLAIASLAVFHGYAHGLEMPEADSALLYGLGFVFSTVLLHLLGIVLALGARRVPGLARLGGLSIALAGVYLTTTVS